MSRDYQALTGRLAAQTQSASGTDFNGFDYSYTDRGNLAEIAESGTFDLTRGYTYDELERLVEVDVPDAPTERESYTLDPEGNRLTSHLSPSHDTDAANRLTSDADYLPLPWPSPPSFDPLDQMIAARPPPKRL